MDEEFTSSAPEGSLLDGVDLLSPEPVHLTDLPAPSAQPVQEETATPSDPATPPEMNFTDGAVKQEPAIPEGALPKAPVDVPKMDATVDFTAQPEAQPSVPPTLTGDRPVSSSRVSSIMNSPIGSLVTEIAQKYNFSPEKLAAMVSIESSGNPHAGTGSYKGLLQLNANEFLSHGGTGSIYDARANLEAGVKSLIEKSAGFQKQFGHEPSATELYLMHQQGEAGLRAHLAHPDQPAWMSMFSTAEGRQKGEGWAKRAIWGNVPTDVRKQFGSVENITSKDFINIWDAKLHGSSVAPSKPVDFAPTVQSSDIQAPAPGPTEGQKAAARVATADADKAQPFYSPLTDSVKQSSLTYRAIQSLGDNFAPDVNFSMTPDVQSQIMKQYSLPEESRAVLGQAVSMGHAQYLAQQEQDSLAQKQRLSSYGLAGSALDLAVGLLDPASLVMAGATSGFADMALAGAGARSVLSRVAGQAMAGAATGYGLSRGMEATGDVHAMDNIGYTVAAGALFGSAFGAISRNPYTLEDAAALQRAGKTVRGMIDDQVARTDGDPQAGSVGAASNPIVTMPALNEPALTAVQNDQVAYTGMKTFFGIPLRFDAAGIVKSNKNPLVRLLGGIGRDAVGTADGSTNWMSASETQTRFIRRWGSKLNETWEPAVKEWAHDQGAKFGPLAEWNYGSKFGDEVSRYVWNRDPTLEFHPAVARAGNKLRSIMEEVLHEAKGADGKYRPVQGFEDINKDKFYLTRMYDRTKYNAAMNEFGESGVVKLIKGAHADLNPDIDEKTLEKIAGWHVKRIYSRANGLDDEVNLMLSGYDREHLAAHLREAGVEDQQIDHILNKTAQSDQPGATARAKHKLPLNENYRLELPAQSGGTKPLAVRDLLVTDAAEIANTYFRQMSGRIGLARWQGRLKDGTVVFNGITSDSEWASAKNRAIEKGMDMGHTDAKSVRQRDAALQNLDFMYNMIVGRPDVDQIGAAADFMRRLGKVDYLRQGWNFGMAQLPETVMPIVMTSLKAAMSHMPELKRIVNERGDLVAASQLMRDWEAIAGRPAHRGLQYFRDAEFGRHDAGMKGKFDNAAAFGQAVVSKVSGLHYIDSLQKSWTAKAVLQRFADLAHKATNGTTGEIAVDKLGASTLRRMRDLGLSDEMLGRVLKQVRDNASLEDGLLHSHKITALNMDKWSDSEARAAFELSAQRLAHKTIQENDVGMMHRWMSKPIAQMVMRFRNFAMGAWTSQFLHGIHMRDMTTFHQMWSTMVVGAMTYALQVQLSAIGRSDKDKYLDKHLDMKNIALGAFNKAGFSSIIPMLYDTAAYTVGAQPAFTFRTSGNPSDVVFGNPAMSFLDDISKMSKGLVQPLVEGRERSQQEWRNIVTATGVGRWLPAQMLLSTMISGNPLHPPKQQH